MSRKPALREWRGPSWRRCGAVFSPPTRGAAGARERGGNASKGASGITSPEAGRLACVVGLLDATVDSVDWAKPNSASVDGGVEVVEEADSRRLATAPSFGEAGLVMDGAASSEGGETAARCVSGHYGSAGMEGQAPVAAPPKEEC